ncbi:MAG TPA: hypothetical protein VKB02_10930 [Pyrinomonadaceae bacterium]|nr:hypothetical protein [Pyrinomonadaceae bacterium]
MSTDEPVSDRANGTKGRRIAVYAVVLLAVFLLGLIPMWFVARARAAERDTAQRDLRMCRLENGLLSAAVESRRGEYERARQAASSFFTSLREQVDLTQDSEDLTSQQRESLRPLLNQRDDLITLLARSDPASADRLAEMYVAFRKSMDTAPSTSP